MKKAIVLLLVCIMMLVFSSCYATEVSEPKRQAKSYYEYFDTVTTVYSYKGDAAEEFQANCDAVAQMLSEYHNLFDIYYEYSGVNNLCTVNKNAGVAPVAVDERLIDFLLYAKEIHALTKGKTNVAMGAVLSAWHDARSDAIDLGKQPWIPSKSELEELSHHTSIDSLVIDKEGGTVFLSDPEASLDVGALAKGYAVDRIRDLLVSRGASSYLLNVGGNLVGIGTRVNGDGWIAGVTHPNMAQDEQFVCKVTLSDVGCVTSGNYQRYFEKDGVRYHHLIDPETLMPATYHSAVTVIVKDNALGDALSTALFCMSREEGEKLIKEIGGVEALWVSADYSEVYHTDGFPIVKE